MEYGTVDHMKKVYDHMASLRVFTARGPKTTLRRWFSWVHSMKEFHSQWNAMLLALCFAGLRTGIFSKDDLPIFKNLSATPEGSDIRDDVAEAGVVSIADMSLTAMSNVMLGGSKCTPFVA